MKFNEKSKKIEEKSGSEVNSKAIQSKAGAEGSTEAKRPAPTREDVRKWCKLDTQSAHAFLGLLLARPDILEALADMLYEDSITGPKIP